MPSVPKSAGQLTGELLGETAESVEVEEVGLKEVEGSRRKTINTCKEIKATTCARASV